MDFHKQLERQMAFLQRSCDGYDAGISDEAIRIATTIRVLIHATRNSTSLLQHLNATTINLLSTTDGAPPNATRFFGLGMLELSSETTNYIPSLDMSRVKKMIPVSQWWDEVVFVIDPQTSLSRKEIVLAAANKDGGAHVDPRLPPEYEALSKDNAIRVFTFSDDGVKVPEPVDNVHFVAIRQMAYELLNSPELNSLLPVNRS